MKSIFHALAFTIFLFLGASMVRTPAQTPEKLTPEEDKATRKIAIEFVDRLNEAGRIEPLLKDFFVDNLGATYRKQEIARQKSSGGWSDDSRILIMPGLEYRAGILSAASDEDLANFDANTFNLMNYLAVNMLNWTAEALAAHKESLDEDELARRTKALFPKSVTEMFNNDSCIA